MVQYDPKEKVQKAIVKVGTNRAFFGHLIFSLEHEESKRVPTMAINKLGQMKYNPEFVDRLDLEHVKTIVTHEILHPAFSHFDRRQSRDNQTWNYATDLAINSKLKKEGFEFPMLNDIIEEAPEEATFLVPDGRDKFDFGNFVIENCSQKSSEEMYSEIKDKMPEITMKIKMGGQSDQNNDESEPQGQGSSEGEGEEQEEGDGQGSGGQSSEEEDGDDEQGEGSGSSSESDSDGQSDGSGSGGMVVEVEKDGEKVGEANINDIDDITDIDGVDEDDVPSKIPTTIDHHNPDPNPEGASDEEVEEKERELEEAKRKAMSHAKKQGQLPAGIDVEVDAEEKAKVNWKQVLQRFVTNSMPHDYTFTRPNRRYHHRGIHLPSEKREAIDICVAVDTSGSVSDQELGEFLSEMYGMLDGFSQVNMKVIQHDAKVQRVDEIDDRSDLENLGFKGRGGTNHVPVFDWINENDNDSRVLVALTDGFTTAPDQRDVPSNLNTIWLVNNYEAADDRMPFGKIIRQPSNFLEEDD